MSEKRVILQVKGLSKDFQIKGKKLGSKKAVLHALQEIDLDIHEGEVLGVIGESGCGKSTLGRCLVGLHKPTEGEILFEGKSILGVRAKDKLEMCRNIQMIFQDPYSSLDPRHTAADSVSEPMVVHKTVKGRAAMEQRVLELLKQVGLDVQHMNRYPHEFSGGQRQRLNVARAISINPRMIICDEPVSALDVSIQAQVINLLKKLQKEYNLTYVFISHDLSVVKYVSDRIVIMYLGRIVEICNGGDIYKNPLHPYTQALLSAIPPECPDEEKERIVLQGEVPSPIGERKGCPLAGRCPQCMERCKNEMPRLKQQGEEGHQVACFLYEKK
ncbi:MULTISPECIES: ABC transporter ATP-binding protein [Clostridia]|uniref:Peptide ABC transporter ATP-binding protein n=1 Tax=Lacrimispora celerecrescens TaxID=29354 RepID=A0A084JRU9_9FIRM|nr:MULTISPECIES: oligopeptide/dipeptide ABC transporter ATP-binding protein [Clostridia]KEZ91683.1 peptide ABC transporter ATP-binding protein [Lacrimispora celerecrescens]MSS09044.1 ATP-binding cassette domain-containing protein [Clostridium sp. WB02_MRS01]